MSTRQLPTSPFDMVAVFIHENGAREVMYWCPGCESHHMVPVRGYALPPGDKPSQHQWDFNQMFTVPTLTPSVNVVGSCHHFVRNGHLEYCPDSAHALAGRTIAMQPIGETLGYDEPEPKRAPTWSEIDEKHNRRG